MCVQPGEQTFTTRLNKSLCATRGTNVCNQAEQICVGVRIQGNMMSIIHDEQIQISVCAQSEVYVYVCN